MNRSAVDPRSQIADRRPVADVPGGVEQNARLTALTGGVLLVLLAVEGLTILSIRSLLTVHVFVGILLIAPVVLKIDSTGYKIVRYYGGGPDYIHAGPPPLLRRILGPLVILATVAVLATGVVVVLQGRAPGGLALQLHKGSFIGWLVVMTLHVLLHLERVVRAIAAEWTARRPALDRRAARTVVLVVTVAAGLVLAVLVVRWAMPRSDWLAGSHGGGR